MANTLTSLIPTMYESLDIVSRELVGGINAVNRNSEATQAAVGQVVMSPVAPAVQTYNIVPGQLPPDDGDQTIGNVQITIAKSKYAPIRWTGEEQLGLRRGGQTQNIVRDQFTQAIRALVNEIEVDVWAAARAAASRAYGTPGTAPFGTAGDFSDFGQIWKILVDNGAPQSDLHLVLGSTAMANLRGKQSGLFKVNEAGNDDLLRRGIVQMIEGFALHTSAAPKTVVAGTVTSAPTVGAHAIGTTALTISTGAGGAVAIKAGDAVTIAGDTNKYVAQADLTVGASSSGTLTIGNPGLRIATSGNPAITVGTIATANIALQRGALTLATRVPAMPEGGDDADDVIELTDPVSGLTFQVAMYRLYRRVKYEVGLAWGVGAAKQEFIAQLLG